MMEINDQTRSWLAEIGRRGGRKSRRKLDGDEARRMVLIREARRAYRDFHARCFWSSPPGYAPGEGDVEWIARQLCQHGGAAGWERAGKLLCRLPKHSK